MYKTALVSLCVLALGVLSVPARAEVNCNQVRRYAETGRSAQDISETMIVPLEEVQKCLKSEGQQAAPTPAAQTR